VPVYEARYRWEKGTRRFWVFGRDERVHAPKYPLSLARVGLAAGGVVAAIGAVCAAVGLDARSPPEPTPTVATEPGVTPTSVPWTMVYDGGGATPAGEVQGERMNSHVIPAPSTRTR
jgi:hypothetical protein